LNRSSLLTSKWVITLTGTLIGAFVALYLNEWMSSRKLDEQKAIATQNILAEMDSNAESLAEALDKHEELFETLTFLGKYLNEESQLIAPPDSFRAFTRKYPHLFDIRDSVLMEKGLYEYQGELNLDLSFPHFELSTIAWETLKSSGLSATYDFTCLLYLETVNKVTQKVIEQNLELFQVIVGDNITHSNEEQIKQLKLLGEYETTIQEMYDAQDDEKQDCRHS